MLNFNDFTGTSVSTLYVRKPMLCMNSMVQSGKEAIEVFKSKLSKEREREREKGVLNMKIADIRN